MTFVSVIYVFTCENALIVLWLSVPLNTVNACGEEGYWFWETELLSYRSILEGESTIWVTYFLMPGWERLSGHGLLVETLFWSKFGFHMHDRFFSDHGHLWWVHNGPHTSTNFVFYLWVVLKKIKKKRQRQRQKNLAWPHLIHLMINPNPSQKKNLPWNHHSKKTKKKTFEPHLIYPMINPNPSTFGMTPIWHSSEFFIPLD